MKRADLSSRVHADAVVLFDLLDEVTRHRSGEAAAADDEVDRTTATCKEDGGLGGRVRATYDDDSLPRTRCSLHRSRGVEDAGALEVREAIE